jgi:uncharacterized protein (TIGR02594 family)
MTNDPYWMQWAKGELGVRELTGKNDGKRIHEYRVIAGFAGKGDRPYCADFAGAALKTAGCDMAGLSPMAKSFLRMSQTLQPYYYGAVCILNSSRGPASGHVGFVVNHTKDMVCLLGANQSNCVKYAWFLKSKVAGLRWPKNLKGLWPVPLTPLIALNSVTGDTSGRDA